MFAVLHICHGVGLDTGSLCVRVIIYGPRIRDLVIEREGTKITNGPGYNKIKSNRGISFKVMQ